VLVLAGDTLIAISFGLAVGGATWAATITDSLGGLFGSRLNMNLRKDKHWSYGVRSILRDARAQRPFYTIASVQTDKT